MTNSVHKHLFYCIVLFVLIMAITASTVDKKSHGVAARVYNDTVVDSLSKDNRYRLKSKDFKTTNNYQSNNRIDRNSKSRNTTELVPVRPGQKFFYTLRTYESSYMIIAFDKNKRIVQNACVTGNNDPYLRSGYYTVQQGVSYLAFSYSNDRQTDYYAEVKEVAEDEEVLSLSNEIEKTTISLPDGDFIGFPTSFVKNGIIYVIYKRTASHGVVPGHYYFPVYKTSSDNGKTWSEEKRINLPLSDSPWLFREYLPYVKNVNGRIYAVFNISVSDSKSSRIRRTAYARLYTSNSKIRVGKLSFLPNIKADGSLVFCTSDQDAINRASSFMIGGDFVVEGEKMFIPVYTPKGMAMCEWNMKQKISEKSFVLKTSINNDTVNQFTEAAFVKLNNSWLLTLRNERHKSPLFILNNDFKTVSYLGDMPFELNNPMFKQLDDEYAILMGRARDCGRHGYLAVLNREGKRVKEAFYEEEPMELSDCCSGSMEIINDKLYIFYYAAASGELDGIKQAVIYLNTFQVE